MQHDGPRAIVTITSLVVDKTVQDRLSYAASKAALVSATRYAAAEWGASGIRVNAVSPGYIDTRLTDWPADDPRQVAKQKSLQEIPLARFGQPEDVAAAVLFLASPLAAYVTGVTLFVDGGWSLA
jgi:NAD(P)-dependent dehydrogenase (short-subunit alcohol dehydrogenase family)